MEKTEADHNTSLCHTYHMQQFGEVIPTEEQSDDLNATLKRFWDRRPWGLHLWHKVSTSIQFENGHYVVAVPWQNELRSA